MTEFIGSRISLISKRDIRYVGTLHEISSENSTVALEQVVSFGTEGRRPDDEVLPSDNVYEYIVFRGSDVKDLRIEEPPKENKSPKPPQVPDDPAILGSARRPTPASTQQPQPAPLQAQIQQPQNQQPAPQQPAQQRQPPPPHFQQPPFPYYYPPPNQRFGPQGFPPGPGFPGMPYGAPPPGWYPPPGHGFPNMPPGQFHPHQMPIGPPGPQQFQKAPQPQQSSAPIEAIKPPSKPQSPKPVATVKLPSSSTTPVPPVQAQKAPPPPTESKPDVAAALAPPAPTISQAISTASQATLAPSNDIATTDQVIPTVAKPIPTGPKSGRIIPAVPIPSPRMKMPVSPNSNVKPAIATAPKSTPAQAPLQAPPQPVATKPSPVPTKTLEEATRDARAAVAAAMAKLPPAPGQKKQVDGQGAMDNLTKKVNEMRTNDNIRTSRQPGTGGYVTGHRGGARGNYRGGRTHSEQQGKKVEVPTTDYDFASANAKFNKQDLVKEAIATGSPIDVPTTNGNDVMEVNGSSKGSEPSIDFPSGVGYNKSSSFFDNISSESKDRTEDGGNRLGGREFRTEERQKNLETFGQGSVDNGYRGGFRGGRARGRGFARGARGGYASRAGGRGGFTRGGRGPVATEG